MDTNKNKITKEIILENALLLIDERDGIRNVTLRDIAKKIGCAHTNLYNYYGSLEEIFWESLAQVLIKMMNYSGEGLNTISKPKEAVYTILSRFIDFSMDHPGWYRLTWLDLLSGKPSPQVEAILQTPGGNLAELIQVTNEEITKEKAESIAQILVGYIQGEITIWLNGRSLTNDGEVIKQRAMTNLKKLYELLIQ